MIPGGPGDPFSLIGERSGEEYMALALREARKAFEIDEVPVGAILVENETGQVVARAHNQRELLRDPTAHAEVLAITQGAAHYGSWRLTGVTLFVTLEPCIMCAGAIVLARIPRVVYGTDDPKAGAHRSVHKVLVDERNNHRPDVVTGIKALECGEILKEFFRAKRQRDGNGNGNSNSHSQQQGGGPPPSHPGGLVI